jgi:hypothetical protein
VIEHAEFHRIIPRACGGYWHNAHRSSLPAEAGNPVITGPHVSSRSVVTGWPAFAGHDSRGDIL